MEDSAKTIQIYSQDTLNYVRLCPGFYVQLTKGLPNIFHRKMLGLMLGWEFFTEEEFKELNK